MAIAVPAVPDDVRAILETTLTDPQLDAFIASATSLIVTSGMDLADCHTDASITQAHIWLSAHLAYLRENLLSSEKMGDSQESVHNPGVLLKGLDSTYYGQTALGLDCSGVLGATGRQAVTVGFFGGAG